MNVMIQQVYFAISRSFKDKRSSLIGAVSAIISLALFIALPIITIPGNTLLYQLKIFRAQDYLLMLFLSVLIGLNIALQVYGMKQQKIHMAGVPKTVARGMLSGITGMFGAMVATATCASCLAFLFGLIGLSVGSVLFVLQHQVYFLGGSILAMLISVYFAARKVNKICATC